MFLRQLNRLLRRVTKLELRSVGTKNMYEEVGETCETPIEAYYVASPKPHFLPVPLERCLLLRAMAFPSRRGQGCPFIETLTLYGRGECSEYADSPLFTYYSQWQPRSAKDTIGIELSSTELDGLPPLAYVFPWQAGNVDTVYRNRVRKIEAENNAHGVQLSAIDGAKNWGPVATEKGKLEFKRLVRTYESIRSIGFDVHHGAPITGEVLVRDRDWRVIVGHGQHRAAALTALGYKTMPVFFCNGYRPEIIRRDDVYSWPQVRSGVMSASEGLDAFDRIFDGRQPRAYSSMLRTSGHTVEGLG